MDIWMQRDGIVCKWIFDDTEICQKKQLERLKFDVKQSKKSEISFQHTETESFEKKKRQEKILKPLQILSKKVHLNEHVKSEMSANDINVVVL